VLLKWQKTFDDCKPIKRGQSLRARQTHLIGAIIPRMNSYAVDETIKGLAKQCQKYESQLILNYTGSIYVGVS
ncbi:hypothetical protein D9V42_15020, partial [Staphylococcus pseudoxylosus]